MVWVREEALLPTHASPNHWHLLPRTHLALAGPQECSLSLLETPQPWVPPVQSQDRWGAGSLTWGLGGHNLKDNGCPHWMAPSSWLCGLGQVSPSRWMWGEDRTQATRQGPSPWRPV